jgi:hypothetical protein
VMVLQGPLGYVPVSGVVSIAGGVLVANGLDLGTTGSIAGYGNVLAGISGGAGAVIDATGPSLTLGNASTAGAISNYGGTLNVGAGRVALLEGEYPPQTDDEFFHGVRTFTVLQGKVTIAGGELSAPKGIELNNRSGGVATLAGYGTINDAFVNRGLVTGGSGADLLSFAGAVSGPGSFLGNVAFAGSYSPGNSPASVTLGSAHFGALDRLTMELGGSVLGSGYDHLIFLEGGHLGGTLDIALVDGFMPARGQSFDLFDGPLFGSFGSVALPALAAGLTWDVSSLYTTGTLSVKALAPIPEPGTCALLLAGLGLLGVVARRRAAAIGARLSRRAR